VAANDPSVAPRDPAVCLRWALWGLVPLAALVALGLYLGFRPSGEAAPPGGEPAATWAAGELKAPDFRLTDEYGQTVSLAALRGRQVIVTFVDPRCTTFCPREAVVLNDAIRALPVGARPAVVAVNVNPPIRKQAVLQRESRRFKWLPQWRWAVGSAPQLEAVWADYNVQVLPAKGDIAHTEAAYLVDAHGDQRALFLWPFHAADIAAALKHLP
jgi:protein SCO1